MFSFNFNRGMVRLAERGLASLAVVLATAGLSVAGGSGKSMGSFGNGNSNQHFFSNVGQTNSNSGKQIDLHKTTNRQNNSNSNHAGSTDKVNNSTDLVKNFKSNGGKDLKLKTTNVMSNGMSNHLKFKDKKDFKDYCHDKCFHDCFHTCPWWYCWNYPHWRLLYNYGCGCWYDVPVVEIHEGVDLQLLAVRMIDAGDAQQGPAYRVWVRNNSHVTIDHPFNVLLLAAHDVAPAADLPQAGVRVTEIEAGQVLPIDIRLPATANQPGLPMLHVLVDSHREIAEVFEDNNGAVLNRADVLPIDAQETASPSPVAVQ